MLLLLRQARIGGRGRLLPGALHGSDEYADAQAQDQQVEQHLQVTTSLANWLAAVMSPNPTVLNTVTVK